MKKIRKFIMTLLLIVALTACSGAGAATVAEVVTNVNEAQNSTTTTVASVEVAGASTAADSAADASAENSEGHEEAGDYVWESSAVVPILAYQPIADRQGVRLELDASHTSPCILVDEGHMVQVLKNLLENALRYTPAEAAFNSAHRRASRFNCV